MMKRTAIAVMLFASQATLAIAQSSPTTDHRVVSPEDSGYLGGWEHPVAAAPRAALSSRISATQRVVGPEDSGYLGGWGQDDASRAQAEISPRAPATPEIAIDLTHVYPEDSGYRGPGV